MKSSLSKSEAQKKIDSLFSQDSLSSEEVRKVKRLAMKYNIKLGENRKLFCKKCLLKLKGRIRLSKKNKIIKCYSCGFRNKHLIK